MSTQHTPLPWGYDLNHTIGRHENGEWEESVVQLPVGTHKRRPTAQEKADCLFIVRACNNHERLVDALKLAREAVTQAVRDGGSSFMGHAFVLDRINHALATATK